MAVLHFSDCILKIFEFPVSELESTVAIDLKFVGILGNLLNVLAVLLMTYILDAHKDTINRFLSVLGDWFAARNPQVCFLTNCQ